MAIIRRMAFVCWELLMLGVPAKWPNIPDEIATIMVALGILGLVLWLIVESVVWRRTRRPRIKEPVDASSNKPNIVAHTIESRYQSGGVTAHTVQNGRADDEWKSRE